jgi:hypothetical protein
MQVVERCLACEAVVNGGETVANAFLCAWLCYFLAI